MSDTTQTQRTILVVEDSPTQALHVQSLLEQAGLRVVLADNGPLGLELANQEDPALIVLDVQMPGMNGFEVCQHLQQSSATAHIPIIMFTRHDDPQAVTRGLEAGVVDYIPKDAFADAVLLETLRQMGIIQD